MKIRYKFADGETSEVEIDGEVGSFIVESRKKEHAGNERERYHSSYSVDAAVYEGREFASDEDPLAGIVRMEENETLCDALAQLTTVQRRRLLMLGLGMSVAEIARAEGASHNSVKESIRSAQKKMKKLLKSTLN